MFGGSIRYRVIVFLFIFIILSVFNIRANGIITIYGPPDTDPDFVTTPGVPQFGVDHDFVASIEIDNNLTLPFDETYATGVLLSTGRHILTAAHVVTGSTWAGQNIFVNFQIPGSGTPLSTVSFLNTDHVKIHNKYAGVPGGFDVAIIELNFNMIDRALNERGYDLNVSELLPRVDPNYGLNGQEMRIAGFGVQGDYEHGDNNLFYPSTTSSLFPGPPLAQKILGKNRISAAATFNDKDEVTSLPTLVQNSDP